MTLVLALALWAFAAEPAIYDAVTSFQARANPSADGRWAYGWKTALEGTFTPYPTREEIVFFGAKLAAWSRHGGLPEATSCPYVGRNLSGSTVTLTPTFKMPPDALLLHPGKNGEFTVVRWNAPWSGEYSIDARFEAHNFTTTDVHILHNRVVVAEEIIEGLHAAHDFSLRHLRLQKGDYIEFAVGYGQNRNYYGDSTGLKAVIRLEPPH